MKIEIELEDWQARLVRERNDLEDRLKKLQAANKKIIEGDTKLGPTQEDLMRRQAEEMSSYLETLNKRISHAVGSLIDRESIKPDHRPMPGMGSYGHLRP